MCILFECICSCRSQWPRGLRRGSAAAGLLGLWVRIPPEAWMFVPCDCCVLSGTVLCFRLITRPEQSECDLETSLIRMPWPIRGCCAMEKKCFYLSLLSFFWNGQRERSDALCFFCMLSNLCYWVVICGSKADVGSHIRRNMFQMQQIILFDILTCTISCTCR
jgi:hypothetical protein